MGNAYDNASLVLTPNGYSAGKMYSAIPTDGSGDLAFSRASTAMRRNSAGLWEEVANNVPRLQYPVGGGCPSWLFEPQATNSILYSTDFSNAAWVVVGTAAKAVSAHASLISGGVAYDITGLDNSFSQYFGQALSGLTTTTFQVFIKAVVVGDVGKKIRIDSNTAGNTDITLTSDWQEFSSYFAASSSGIYFFGKPNSGTPATQFTICYAGREAGSVATSPIITAGSAVTRLKDVPVATVTLSSNNTVYYEGSVNALGGYLLDFQNNSLGRQFVCQLNANGSVNIDNYDNAVDRSNNTASIGTLTANTKFKLCLVSTSTTRTLFINGVKFNTITSSFSGGDRIYSQQNFGDAGSMNNQSEIIYYQAALSDSEAIELTTL